MKKLLLFSLVLCLFVVDKVAAQCYAFSSLVSEIIVRDTTYEIYAADTSLGTAGYTWTWAFDDGQTFSGPVIKKPFTAIGGCYYTVTMTGPGGCHDSRDLSAQCDFVFNCHALVPYYLDDYHAYNWDTWFIQSDLSNPNSVRLQPGGGHYDLYGIYSSHMHTRVTLDWGNGRIVNTLWAQDSAHNIGGLDDTAHASHYQYSGSYIINASYSYSYDTMTCPYVPIPPISIHVGGPVSHPLISGPTTYCTGDTLRLYPSDTTHQFYDLFHSVDTSLAPGGDYYPWNPEYWNYNLGAYPSGWYFILGGNGISRPSSYRYAWFDQYYNLLSVDTSLTLNNLSIGDSGNYILRISEAISQRDTEFMVHVAVNGSNITKDSVMNPTCGFSNGFIKINCFHASDSVSGVYTFNGSNILFSGRTNSTGYLKIAGLSEGYYSNIRLRSMSGGCKSNSLTDTIILQAAPVLYIGDTAAPPVCAGGTLTLYASIAPVGATYSWTGPAGFSSTLQHPVITGITAAQQGLYTVAVDAGSCALPVTATANVTVVATVPNLTATHFPDSICMGYTIGSAVFLASSDTTIIRANMGVGSGTATVTLTQSNVCGTSYYSQSVYVKNAPTLPAITGPDLLCIGDTTTYHIATTGGKWGSYYPSLIVDSITGFTAYHASGTAAVRYIKTYPNHCTVFQSKNITLGAPIGSFIVGNLGIYPGGVTTLTAVQSNGYNAEIGGVWSSGSPSLASVASGVVSGTSVGSAAISYTKSNACGTFLNTTNVFVSDWIDTKIAGGANSTPLNSEHVPGLAFKFKNIIAVEHDTMQNTYILDNSEVIYKVDKNGDVSTVAGAYSAFDLMGSYLYNGDGGLAKLAKLGGPMRIACDKAGNLYMSTSNNSVIRKISINGIITRIAGIPNTEINGVYGWGGFNVNSGDGGQATAAGITADYLAADDIGNVYFSDPWHNKIRKIDATGVITTFAGNDSGGYAGDGGLATSAVVGFPQGIAIDRTGNLIVSTMGYLRKIDHAGIISTIAGLAGSTSVLDGPATSIAPIFNGCVKVDNKGNIFNGATSIVKIDTNGLAHGVAGGNDNIFNNSVGYPFPYYYDHFYTSYYYCYFYTAYYTLFSYPPSYNGYSVNANTYGGFGVDDSGGVYVGDAYSNTLRKEGPPSVEIHASPDSACHGPATITFTAQGHNTGRTTSYQWQKNGINVGTDNITYTDPSFAAGDTIACKVYLSAGGQYLAMSKRSVAVDENPPVVAAITGAAVVCEAATTTLDNTSVGGTWTSSSSAATVAAGVITGVSAGTAIVTYMVTNACGTASDTILVTVNPLPHAGTITGTTTVCETATTTLTNTVTGGTWSTGSSAITLSGGAVTGLTAGSAVITYSITNSCGTDTDTLEMTVNPLPQAGTITGASSVCAGSTITLGNATTGGVWSSSAATVTVSGSAITGVAAGPAIITYAVTNSCGTATDTALITVNAPPSAGTITGSASVCQGAEITLNSGTTGGTWSSSSSAAIVTGGVVTGVSNGTAVIAYSVTNTCGTAADTMQVTVNALPAAGIIIGTDTLCQGSSAMLTASVIGGVWHSSDATIGTVSSTGTFAATSGGVVYVTYSVTNSCGTSAASHTMLVRSADECGPGGTYYAFNIYPNPSTGDITVEIPSPGTNAVITVMDITSRVIQTVYPQANQLLVPISLGNLPSATYIVKLQANGNVYVGKVVVD